MLAADIERVQVEQCLPPEVQYACLYWIEHPQKSGARLHDNDQVHQFLQVHLLHWLEVLSWMRKMSEGIHAIMSLESIALTCDCPNFRAFIYDVKRFVHYNRPMIEHAPLQIYYGAIVFSPVTSIVRKHFEERIPRWLQRPPEVERDWTSLLQTLESHTDIVESVAFSLDSRLVLSGSWDHTIKLWDVATGGLQQTLESHAEGVKRIAFSPDNRMVASGSRDSTLNLWDVATGVVQKTIDIQEDGESYFELAFSPDGKLIASGSLSVRLWNVATGKLQRIVGSHRRGIEIYPITALVFSPDGQVLAYGSNGIKLWDFTTGTLKSGFKGRTELVGAMAFSEDGKQLVSSADNGEVEVWDVATGNLLQKHEVPTDKLTHIAFSPYGRLVASCSSNRTVKLWDVATGSHQRTLEGHTGYPRNSILARWQTGGICLYGLHS